MNVCYVPGNLLDPSEETPQESTTLQSMIQLRL